MAHTRKCARWLNLKRRYSTTEMPGNPRAIITEAEQRFPLRIVIRVPGDGIGTVCVRENRDPGINDHVSELRHREG
jgi:hypothetical protein